MHYVGKLYWLHMVGEYGVIRFFFSGLVVFYGFTTVLGSVSNLGWGVCFELQQNLGCITVHISLFFYCWFFWLINFSVQHSPSTGWSWPSFQLAQWRAGLMWPCVVRPKSATATLSSYTPSPSWWITLWSMPKTAPRQWWNATWLQPELSTQALINVVSRSTWRKWAASHRYWQSQVQCRTETTDKKLPIL